MLVCYIMFFGIKDGVFYVESKCIIKFNGCVIIDVDFLELFGCFYILVNIWDLLVRFSVWIEFLLVNEWVVLM